MVKRVVLALILGVCLIIGLGPAKAEAGTLEFSSGFEMGSIYTEWVSVTGAPAISSTVVHTGDYSMRCSGNSAAYVVAITSTPYRVSVYIRVGAAPLSDTTIIGHPSVETAVKLTPDRYLDLYDTTTLEVEGTTQLSLDTWYRISVSVEHNGTSYAYYYINGSEEGNAVVGGTYTYGGIGFLEAPGNDAEVFFDDYASDYVDSTADLGDIRTIRASPNAIGDLNEYDQTSGYTYVDEFPANDADFTEDNGSDAAYEAYNIEDTTDIGIGGSDTIEAVRIWIRGDRDGGGATLHTILVIDNTVGYASYDLPFDGIAWYSWYHPDLPDGGGDWTQARFNAFQIGSAHAGAQDQRIHCVLAMVSYKVSAVGCSPDIANTPDNYNFGTIGVNVTANTTLTYFTLTNNSGGPITVSIQGTDLIGGTAWTLSDDASTGNNIYGMKAGKSTDGDYIIIIKKNSPYNNLVAAMPDSSDINWGMKIWTPTDIDDGVGKSGNITVMATCD